MPSSSSMLFEESGKLNALFSKYGKMKILPVRERFWNPDPSNIYLVSRGLLKTYIVDDEGNENFLWFLGRGSLIPMYSPKVLKHMYIMEPTTLMMCEKNVLVPKLISKDIEYFNEFMTQIYSRYDEMMLRSIKFSKEDATTRLCRLLSELARLSSDRLTDVHLKNCLTRHDMAYYVGVHVGTISRCLAHLEKRGLIEHGQGLEIIVPDVMLLESAALGNVTA